MRTSGSAADMTEQVITEQASQSPMLKAAMSRKFINSTNESRLKMDCLSDLHGVSVSIVSHGHGHMVCDALRGLAAQTGVLRLQVLLTLNAPDEAICLPELPNLSLTIIRNLTPRGFSANHNTAASLATEEYFLVMNPDIVIEDTSVLSTLIGDIRRAGYGFVAPKVVGRNGEPEDFARRNITPPRLLCRALSVKSADRFKSEVSIVGTPFFWLAGMFLLFDKEHFRSLGGFDERFFLYCEDYDICARAAEAGVKYGVTWTCSVVHLAQRKSRANVRHLIWHLTSISRVWTSKVFWRRLGADLRTYILRHGPTR